MEILFTVIGIAFGVAVITFILLGILFGFYIIKEVIEIIKKS